MFRVLILVRNRDDEEVTMNYGTHDSEFNAIHALMSFMAISDSKFYTVQEYRIEVI